MKCNNQNACRDCYQNCKRAGRGGYQKIRKVNHNEKWQ
jgi:hypothetical protein